MPPPPGRAYGWPRQSRAPSGGGGPRRWYMDMVAATAVSVRVVVVATDG